MSLIEFRVLYEKEKLNSRIADLANRFKVAVLYGYAEYDSQSDKASVRVELIIQKVINIQLPIMGSLKKVVVVGLSQISLNCQKTASFLF